MKSFSAFSAFSGIGGFDLALEKNKVEIIGHSEIDKFAEQIYCSKFNNHNYGDITKINARQLPNFALLVGGFPCQAFSIAGKRQGFIDTRGQLFFDLARILQAKKPQYFIFENVKGLLSHDNGRTFATIIKTLTELGYSLEWEVLNSKDFGIPQHRERVFIIGYFGGFAQQKIFPIKKANNQVTKTGVVPIQNPTQVNSWRKGRRFKNDGDVAFTITTRDQHGIMKKGINRKYIRRFTPLECERLQGFPDNWTKVGINEAGKLVQISDTQRYKSLGNAVSVSVVKYLIKKLIPN